MARHRSDDASAPSSTPADDAREIRDAVAHATHFLPSQGPLDVFVHHNTLHAFEDLSFDEGLRRGAEVYGCEPYLTEERYWQKRADGRIPEECVAAVLADDLGARGSQTVAGLASRIELRSARLRVRPQATTAAEIRWILRETYALTHFADGVPPARATEMLEATGAWLAGFRPDACRSPLTSRVTQQALTDGSDRRASPESLRSITLRLLFETWKAQATRFASSLRPPPRETCVRPRDVLLDATAEDTDLRVNERLIPFCSAFVDQGIASWRLPDRDDGFLRCFLATTRAGVRGGATWCRDLTSSLAGIETAPDPAVASITDSLEAFGVGRRDRTSFLRQTLLALRGWAGMIWQVESNAPWLRFPAPKDSLLEFLAVRLLLDRLAADDVSRRHTGQPYARERFEEDGAPARLADTPDHVALVGLLLSQHLGWSPRDLSRLSDDEWDDLFRELRSFDSLERRSILHRAFERTYLERALASIQTHAGNAPPAGATPAFQLVCCLDEREESFRRAVEEVDPDCETLGVAGFFGVAMYHRGVTEAHFRPLCPVSILPTHSVTEEPAYSFRELSRRRQSGQRRVGRLSHGLHVETRTLLGGLVTGLAGALAAVPLVTRILFPRSTALLRRTFGRLGEPPLTELRIERDDGPEDGAPTRIGYTLDEMADVVAGLLRSIGLAAEGALAPVIVICGHGSSSLNNPQEAAHDCGACGGGRGGPNARAFALMANDPRVRELLEQRGIRIPPQVQFVGAYHNTCDDSVRWYDLDRLPRASRPAFERAQSAVDEARARNALERCRRFESAPLSLSPGQALRHVEGRAEDLSQTRPEYGHATNALCLVGRRQWSRGLFLDRRAFLTSYDPRQDDEAGTILEGLLRAVIPVCSGISLEYYFSYLDPTGYGCGTKLPHNITSLLGVMDGAQSDLRTGLPWQMVEIHEPFRLQFVIETTAPILERILQANPSLARIVDGGWVHLAIIDPRSLRVRRYEGSRFHDLPESCRVLSTVRCSEDWFRGRRDHLDFAQIRPGAA